MMKRSLLFLFAIVFIKVSIGQDTAQIRKAAEYKIVVTERADKIVAKLGITNTKTYTIVKEEIAQHYIDLNDIYDDRDAKLKALKANTTMDKATMDASKKSIETDVDTKVAALHPKFLSQLGKNLSPAQIDMVKDGLTYDVLHVTYKGYQDEVPTLTEPQKAQILAWLTEARERSMDAGSSKEKHGWFDKYKGRINNYLSAQGYDLQKEGKAWQERIKAAEAAKKQGS
jgi:hypothetical protein